MLIGTSRFHAKQLLVSHTNRSFHHDYVPQINANAKIRYYIYCLTKSKAMQVVHSCSALRHMEMVDYNRSKERYSCYY